MQRPALLSIQQSTHTFSSPSLYSVGDDPHHCLTPVASQNFTSCRRQVCSCTSKISPSLICTVPRTVFSHQTTVTGLYLILITLTKPDPGLRMRFLSPPDSFDLTPGPDLPYDLDSQFNVVSTSGAALLILLR